MKTIKPLTMFTISSALLLCCISSVFTESANFTTNRVRLREEILTKYSNSHLKIRPSNTTDVNVTLALTSLKKLDIESQTLSTTFYLHLSWFDGRLRWVPTAEQIEYFLFDIKEIWTPNFVIDNFVEDVGLIGIYDDGPVPLRVSHNGHVVWILRISTVTVCRADITYYPYDKQSCHINITEWAYTSSEVNLVPGATEYYPEEVYTGSYTEDGEWELVSKAVYEQHILGGFGLLYKNLQYTFEFQRRPTWYIPILMIPLGLMSILMAGVFLVPVNSGEKMTYSLTVMLSFTVTLSFIANTLPSVSSSYSLIGVYVAIVLVTGGLVALLSAVVLHYKEKEELACKIDKVCLVIFGFFYVIMMMTFTILLNTQ